MSKNNKLNPWLKFDFEDFFEDEFVSEMTDEAVGFYMRILRSAWKNGCSIPKDHDRIRSKFKMTKHKFKVLWPQIEPCFFEQDGKLFQRRLLNEFLDLEKTFQKNSDIGRENQKKGQQRLKDANSNGEQDSENSEKRTNISSVDSVNRPPPPPTYKTEPIKNLPTNSYSNKTKFQISQAMNQHKNVFNDDVNHNSPLMKKLWLALCSIPQIDPEKRRILAYVIQAKDTKSAKNSDERLRLGITMVKGARYAPADNSDSKAKQLISSWGDDLGLDTRILSLIPDKAC